MQNHHDKRGIGPSAFLRIIMAPHWPDQPERHEVINTRNITKVSDSYTPGRFVVSFETNTREGFGEATADDLIDAGIPLPRW